MDTVYQIVWLALLIIFAVAEAATVGLTSVWFAIGSLGALVCALAGGGQEARVTQDIDNIQGTGAVTIGGVTWTARSEHDTPIPAGAMVRVLRIEGVKVIVEE